MGTKFSACGLVGLVLGTFLAAMACAEVVIETVWVGNPGNLPDTRYETPGFGAVDYEYAIGEFEVTAGQFCEFLNAVAGIDRYGLYSDQMWSGITGCKIERYTGSGTTVDPYRYRVSAERKDRPVGDLSWGDAARFANWLHNGQPGGMQDASTTEDGSYSLNGATTHAEYMAVTRNPDATWVIPTEDEWYKAAYHQNDGPTGNYFDYPTGTDNTPSNDLIDPDPGNNANFRELDGYTLLAPYYSTEVGAFENSASPYGTYDQGGNVYEWNETAVDDGFRLERGVRGGIWGGPAQRLHASYQDSQGPTSGTAGYGLRVARVPEPGSALLLACGIGGLMWWRGRLSMY